MFDYDLNMISTFSGWVIGDGEVRSNWFYDYIMIWCWGENSNKNKSISCFQLSTKSSNQTIKIVDN